MLLRQLVPGHLALGTGMQEARHSCSPCLVSIFMILQPGLIPACTACRQHCAAWERQKWQEWQPC